MNYFLSLLLLSTIFISGCGVLQPEEANFPISELGITLALPTDLKDDLTYTVGNEASHPLVPDGKEIIVVSFNSKKLSKQAEQVNMHCGFLGEIVKTKKLQQVLGVSGTVVERQPITHVDYKMGDYYISFYSPQEGCASLNDETLITTEYSIMKALKDSIVKALP